MYSVSPVFTEAQVPSERVVALEQVGYIPVIVAFIEYQDGYSAAAFRLRLTSDERSAIADGADIILVQPGRGELAPIATQLAMPGEYPLEGIG